MSVEWNSSEDAQFTWRRGVGPVRLLTQSYEIYWFQGWTKAAREKKGGEMYRLLDVKGYRYSPFPAQRFRVGTPKAQEAAQKEMEKNTPQKWEQEWLPKIKGDLARLRGIALEKLPNDELASLLHETLTWYSDHGRIHAHMGGTTIEAVDRLVGWYLRRFPDAPESEPYKLLQGQPNLSMRKGHLLWELGQSITPDVLASLRSRQTKDQWEHVPPSFRQKVDAYLDEFWGEDPKSVMEIVLRYVEHSVSDPLAELGYLAAERERFVAETLAKLNKVESKEFEELLGVALANHPLTEDHNYWLDGPSMQVIDVICNEFGWRLTKLGVLDTRGQVNFLRVDELIRWGFGLADPLRPLVLRRMSEYEESLKNPPPEFLGAAPPPTPTVVDQDRYWGPSAPLESVGSEIRGIGASPGVVQGRALKVRNFREGLALRPGEILVCARPTPHWTPLFGLATALVTDTGGSLCHAAVVAREYRLPAVVGTNVATEKIRNGQLLEVDGTRGVVRVV